MTKEISTFTARESDADVIPGATPADSARQDRRHKLVQADAFVFGSARELCMEAVGKAQKKATAVRLGVAGLRNLQSVLERDREPRDHGVLQTLKSLFLGRSLSDTARKFGDFSDPAGVSVSVVIVDQRQVVGQVKTRGIGRQERISSPGRGVSPPGGARCDCRAVAGRPRGRMKRHV